MIVSFKPTLRSGKSSCFKPTRGWYFQTIFKYKHESKCSNSCDLVSTWLCASHSKVILITGTRTHNVYKNHIMISRGRSLIGRAGVLIAWPFPIVPKFPSRGNFGDDGHVAFSTESGFPKFPIIKYLGGDSVSGKAVHVWHFFQKNLFSKRFAGFGLFDDSSVLHCTLRD